MSEESATSPKRDALDKWTIRSMVDGGDRVAIGADFFGVGRGSVRTTFPSDHMPRK
jgi:hypothetical protein